MPTNVLWILTAIALAEDLPAVPVAPAPVPVPVAVAPPAPVPVPAALPAAAPGAPTVRCEIFDEVMVKKRATAVEAWIQARLAEGKLQVVNASPSMAGASQYGASYMGPTLLCAW